MASPDFLEALSAATRAIGADATLRLRRGSNRKEEGTVLPLPPFDEHNEGERQAMRGIADHAALMHRYHNAGLHQKLRPAHHDAAAVFDALETARVDLLGGEHMRGVQRNVAEHAEASIQQGQQDAALPAIFAFLLRREMVQREAPPSLRASIHHWRSQIAQSGEEQLTAMRQTLADQRRFAEAARGLMQHLQLWDQPTPAGKPEKAESHAAEEEDTSQAPETSALEQDDHTPPPSSERREDMSPTPLTDSAMAESLTGEDATPQEVDPRRTNASDGGAHGVEGFAYRMYATQFDEVVTASQLATHQELEALHQQLEQKLPGLRAAASRMATKLQRLLLAKQERSWLDHQEEGLLDTRRLARLVISPGEEGMFKRAQDAPYRDTVVTLLLDNSGSMRGRPITIAALSAEMLAQVLERCGVKVEILGFTTREWKGGQSAKRWGYDGRPQSPGRLNDLRHIIYKQADTPWRKARRHLGLMLKDGILKENIDGEALLWARSRLLKRPERRRILMVISDGAPVDDSTLAANGGNYLDAHLRQVIAEMEAHPAIELMAIGIGHDVTRYYKRAVTLSDIERLPETMTEELTKLFRAA